MVKVTTQSRLVLPEVEEVRGGWDLDPDEGGRPLSPQF